MKVLLSIKPEYAAKIFDGSKRFEFRKAIFRREGIRTVVVYASLPVGRVVGEFTVGDIIVNEPSSVWKVTKAHSGISRTFYDQYFGGKSLAFAIEIRNPTLYPESLGLDDVHPNGTAPQSFCYLA